jgi:hypothetical protein
MVANAPHRTFRSWTLGDKFIGRRNCAGIHDQLFCGAARNFAGRGFGLKARGETPSGPAHQNATVRL